MQILVSQKLNEKPQNHKCKDICEYNGYRFFCKLVVKDDKNFLLLLCCYFKSKEDDSTPF